MDKYNQRDYYHIVDAMKKSPGFLDTLIEDFTSQGIELVGWNDHITEFGNVKKEIIRGKDDQGNEIVQHDRYDGNVFQEGTPVDSFNLGRMEWNDLVNFLQNKYLMDTVRRLGIEFETLKGGLSNNMPHNSFVADMQNINEDLVILSGFYDAQNGRGVI